jgi:hypothetical protein
MKAVLKPQDQQNQIKKEIFLLKANEMKKMIEKVKDKKLIKKN